MLKMCCFVYLWLQRGVLPPGAVGVLDPGIVQQQLELCSNSVAEIAGNYGEISGNIIWKFLKKTTCLSTLISTSTHNNLHLQLTKDIKVPGKKKR
jgi:hypothetical protein